MRYWKLPVNADAQIEGPWGADSSPTSKPIGRAHLWTPPEGNHQSRRFLRALPPRRKWFRLNLEGYHMPCWWRVSYPQRCSMGLVNIRNYVSPRSIIRDHHVWIKEKSKQSTCETDPRIIPIFPCGVGGLRHLIHRLKQFVQFLYPMRVNIWFVEHNKELYAIKTRDVIASA